MNTLLRPALVLLLALSLLTGLAYPLAVTGVAQLLFPAQANGSLVRDDTGRVRGSYLIAQRFDGPEWFASRPSAGDFATQPSAASNLAASNPALAERVAQAAQRLGTEQGPVPLALLTTSASGLDPDLPPEAVAYQVPRVARARGLSVEQVQALVQAQTRRPWVGPPVVNVLALNLALDGLTSSSR